MERNIDQEVKARISSLKQQGRHYIDCVAWYQLGLESNPIFIQERKMGLVDPIAEENLRFFHLWGNDPVTIPQQIKRSEALCLYELGIGIYDLLTLAEKKKLNRKFEREWGKYLLNFAEQKQGQMVN